MIILIVLIIFVVFFFAVYHWTDNEAFLIPGVVFSICLFFFSIIWPVTFYGLKADIIQFNSVQQTVEACRTRGENIENAAIQIKIIDSNKWLASTKYWNSTIFDIFIPDSIEQLESIK